MLELTDAQWVEAADRVLSKMGRNGKAFLLEEGSNSYVLENPDCVNSGKRYTPTVNLITVVISFEAKETLSTDMVESIIESILNKYHLDQIGYTVFGIKKPEYRKEKAHHLFFKTSFAVHPMK